MNPNDIIRMCGPKVWASINGHHRGDGRDVEAYQLGHRYLICVSTVQGLVLGWYTADTLEAAQAVGAAGWTPGHAPGRYRSVSRPERLPEIRQTCGAPQAVDRLDI